MKLPKFYCTKYIECHNNLKKYQPKDCKQQCQTCMDIIIDHHFNKKKKLLLLLLFFGYRAVSSQNISAAKMPMFFPSPSPIHPKPANVATTALNRISDEGRGILLPTITLEEIVSTHEMPNETSPTRVLKAISTKYIGVWRWMEPLMEYPDVIYEIVTESTTTSRLKSRDLYRQTRGMASYHHVENVRGKGWVTNSQYRYVTQKPK